MAIVCVGVDLAKNVFAVHGINEAGCPELVRPAVPLDQLLALVSALLTCSPQSAPCCSHRPIETRLVREAHKKTDPLRGSRDSFGLTDGEALVVEVTGLARLYARGPC
ncbi:hypothetical protein KGA65_11565 [Ideonella sp. B7]|nr:hypothetical protein [Ideonella benzenivorans]